MNIKCATCQSSRHSTLLHNANFNYEGNLVSHQALVGEERLAYQKEQVSSKCTQICGNGFSGKSCAKTILVNVYPMGQRHNTVKMYAIFDDQSNRTLARSEFFQSFNINTSEVEYSLSSCAGKLVTSGKTAHGYIIESLDGLLQLDLPTILECNEIPNVRDEIATPEVVYHHAHLTGIARCIPPLNDQASIMLLIGRDLPEAHHVYDQRTGPKGAPYAQKLKFGWVVIGETCLGGIHETNYVNVNKTFLLNNGRSSLFQPCVDEFVVVQQPPTSLYQDVNDPMFKRNEDDNKPSLSVDDRDFIKIMDTDFRKFPNGNWSAPLPFRSNRQTLPNNYDYAFNRAKSLHISLQRNEIKRQHFIEFMGNVLENGHAEITSALHNNEECWYLPVFGVYHPQKPKQ